MHLAELLSVLVLLKQRWPYFLMQEQETANIHQTVGTHSTLLHWLTFTQSLFSVSGPLHSACLSDNRKEEEGEQCGMMNKRWTRREGGKCEIDCSTGHPPFPNTSTHWSPGPLLNSGSVSLSVLVDINMHMCVWESKRGTKRAGLSITGLCWHLSQYALYSEL